MQSAATCFKCTGIEEIEEVGHYESREEQCQLVCRHVSLGSQLQVKQISKLDRKSVV